MNKKSAGILLYNYHNDTPVVFLVHPGGPFWATKDLGTWSIPKGEFEAEENPLEAAKREMEEETGIKVDGAFIELTPVQQKSGKIVYAWALQKEADASQIRSNNFEMEWPPKSGRKKTFPEIDKAAWLGLGEARKKINEGQVPLLDELEKILTTSK